MPPKKSKPSNIQISHADCFTELAKLENNSIDCVITDPPYFLDKLDSSWDAESLKHDVKNSHIKHLPKGMKYSKAQVKDLENFYTKLCEILFTKMKPGAYFLSFSSPRLYHAIAMACENANFEVRDMINWVYTQSMPKGMSVNHVIDNLDMPPDEKESLKTKYQDFKTPQIRSCFEPICVAFKPISVSFVKNELMYQTGLIDFSQKVGDNHVPANIVTTEEFDPIYDKNFLVPKPSKKEKIGNTHPTVKPLALMEHLVKIFSKEGSLVLDPFLGSGTTGLACKNSGRKFIGYEINEEYYRIAKDRLA